MKSKCVAAVITALTLAGTSRGVVFAEEIAADESNTTFVAENIFADDNDTAIVTEGIFVDDNDTVTEALVGKEFCFPNGGEVVCRDGSLKRISPRERFSVISCSNGVYRIYIPKSLDIFFLQQNVSDELEMTNSRSLILGDLDHNGRLDAFDLCALEKGVIYGWADIQAYYMGDINADNSVNIADVVCMQSYLLGVEAEFN